jgi:hypothetical protein
MILSRRNRNYQNTGFQNQNQNQQMMGQGQILVKGPGGRAQFMAQEQNFMSNYNCNDIIFALKELHYLEYISNADISNALLSASTGSLDARYKKMSPTEQANFKNYRRFTFEGPTTSRITKAKEMQKATGGNAGETFNQLAGLGTPRFTISQLSDAVLSDFQNSIDGDVLRMKTSQFYNFKTRFVDVTSTNLATTKCPKEIIELVLDKLLDEIKGNIGLDEYTVYDGKRKRRRRRKSVVSDGRKRRRSKRSKRSRKSRSRKSKSDGKKRRRSKSRSRKSKRSKSKSDGKRRKSRSKKSRSKKSRSRRSKHMSAKKLLKLLGKL